jgi:hypothetical protein
MVDFMRHVLQFTSSFCGSGRNTTEIVSFSTWIWGDWRADDPSQMDYERRADIPQKGKTQNENYFFADSAFKCRQGSIGHWSKNLFLLLGQSLQASLYLTSLILQLGQFCLGLLHNIGGGLVHESF